MTTAAKRHSERVLALETIRQQFERNGDAAAALSGRTAVVDSEVKELFSAHLAPAFPKGLAVLAVGGFGRRELFPHSDVDVCLLVENERIAAQGRSRISSFLQSLWDGKLRVSHSVRTVAECCEIHNQNIELNISLLDRRFLVGDEALYALLDPRLANLFDSQRMLLARHLCRLARLRHGSFQDTIYHLEPNIKESPGGLRDLHLIGWLTKLEACGISRFRSSTELERARNFVFALRCILHYRARRDDNILNFDAQEELPEQTHSPQREPESWMREYYRHVRFVYGVALRAMDTVESKNSSLLTGFQNWRSRLSNADFTVARGRVYFKAPHAMEKEPELVLRLFHFVARHGIRLSVDAERRIQEHFPYLERYFGMPRPLWPVVADLLAQPHAGLGLRAAQDCAILGLIFPEWKLIECYVVRDYYHRYTVDEHTIVAIECLQALARSTEPEHRRFAALLAEIEEPAVLRLALLFHDVGKGLHTANHSEQSVLLATSAMERIGVPQKHQRLVNLLICQHLSLSAAMISRDLDDPVTTRMLAGKVGTIEALKYLTLLTYADIAAVNPTALSPWRMEQLWRVYTATYRELTRELQTDRIAGTEKEADERDIFLKGLPARYLRTRTGEEIRLHLELAARRRHDEAVIDIGKTKGGYVVTALAKDRLNLFASVAGALASFGMNILKAEAFANQQGIVLDTFVFEDPSHTLDLNPTEVDRLKLTLERVLLGRVAVHELLLCRPQRIVPAKRGRIAPGVAFDNEASDTATLIEITAEDRPGLLYDIAAALSRAGCNIEVVLVSTQVHRAIDVFYVSADGKKLDQTAMPSLRESLEAACRGEMRG
ncbi:MAG: ACT domain-containing protein [Bryobacterales bacterium]|nr:ACT domain-containing protein [Bryobacterales bacterium]